MQRPAIVPVVIAYSAAISVCEKGLQHQRALHLLRAMLRHAIVPGVAAHDAAISGCEILTSDARLAIVPPASEADMEALGAEDTESDATPVDFGPALCPAEPGQPPDRWGDVDVERLPVEEPAAAPGTPSEVLASREELRCDRRGVRREGCAAGRRAALGLR